MKNFAILFLGFILSFNTNAQVTPLIQNDWQNFQWPYNAYFPVDTGSMSVNGHYGNACGVTAIARIMHYYQFPVNGNGILDFYDFDGLHWYVNLDSLDLDYTSMPYALQWNDPDSIYHEVASLMFAVGAFGARIKIGWGGSNDRIMDSLPHYFNYSEQITMEKRWEYSRNDWISLIKNELDNGRPILIDGRTPSSPAPWEPGNWEGHYFICDGYNSAGLFHINYSFGGIEGYYDIDSMDNYSAYHQVFVNFFPDYMAVDEKKSPDNDKIKIFPNPVKSKLSVETHSLPSDQYVLSVHTFDGKLVYSQSGKLFHLNNKIDIPCSDWENGLYFISLSNKDYFGIEKFMVIR